MAKLVKKSVVPLYLVAALWVVWALFGPMWAWWHFALLAGGSVGLYLLGRKLVPDKVFTVPDPEPEPQQAPPSDPLTEERNRAVSELRRLNNNIADPVISEQIAHMQEVTEKIFDQVAQRPEKLPQIRRFLNYYLPTTLKLLNAYDRMDQAGVAGANIDGTTGKIEAILNQVVQAYDRQLDALFADEALDISTDITVLEQMLAQEGIGGMKME